MADTVRSNCDAGTFGLRHRVHAEEMKGYLEAAEGDLLRSQNHVKSAKAISWLANELGRCTR